MRKLVSSLTAKCLQDRWEPHKETLMAITSLRLTAYLTAICRLHGSIKTPPPREAMVCIGRLHLTWYSYHSRDSLRRIALVSRTMDGS